MKKSVMGKKTAGKGIKPGMKTIMPQRDMMDERSQKMSKMLKKGKNNPYT